MFIYNTHKILAVHKNIAAFWANERKKKHFWSNNKQVVCMANNVVQSAVFNVATQGKVGIGRVKWTRWFADQYKIKNIAF